MDQILGGFSLFVKFFNCAVTVCENLQTNLTKQLILCGYQLRKASTLAQNKQVGLIIRLIILFWHVVTSHMILIFYVLTA